jgi:hypothetical protein
MSQYSTEQDRIPVPRARIFVLRDGTFVVQWEENRVQALLSGRYHAYSDEQFGTPINDYELHQLQNSGVVEDYDEELVYLAPSISASSTSPNRSYYLNTSLAKSEMDTVRDALEQSNLNHKFSVRVQEIFVIIRGNAGMAFPSFDEAERAREVLCEQLPDLLGKSVVAFVEINPMP